MTRQRPDGERVDGERGTARLFVACYPSAEALAELDAALAAARDAWPGLRWSPRDQWHLTLAFYGEVALDRVDELAERLTRAAARCPPLALRLTRVGAFPSARRARVCWVAVEAGSPDSVDDAPDVDGGPVTGDVAELRRLAARCVAAGRRIGVPGDDKPYRPHLTIARPRRPPLDIAPLVADLADHAGPSWVSGEIRLVRSHLGAQVRHETLRVLPLPAGAG